MDRQFTLDEIRRTAEGNGGKPLGRQRFEIETGIKPHEWMRFWARFGDAQREAGHAANSLQRAFDEDAVMGRVVELTRELKRFPTHGDLRVKRTLDPSCPSKGVFGRFRKHELVSKALAFCAAHPGNEDVASVCASLGAKAAQAEARAEPDSSKDGFVYLVKSGRFYKIGKTNHVGRRERELAIQLPEDVRTVHYIRTDDPHGIESYWHARFHPKRKNGEWFELSTDDVAAFRRRKFM